MSKAFRSLFTRAKPREEKNHKRTLTLGFLHSPARRIIMPKTPSKPREADLTENANPIYKSVSVRSQKKFKWGEFEVKKKVDESEIEVYREVFQDIITQNQPYGGLLAKVKSKYESYFDSELHI